MLGNSDVEIQYQKDPQPRFAMIDDMWIEPGTKDDWDKLHDLHYKAQSLPPGPHYWRCVTGDGQLVGVIVLNTVSLLSTPRHQIFPRLKPGADTKFTNVYRAAWLNDNMRRAGRIVTDTLFRGLGISYRMVNLAMRMEGKRFVEIQSSMSKFNPFDLKAGFMHAKLRPAAAYERGLALFRLYFDSHPADHENVLKELRSFPDGMQKSIMRDIKKFYYDNSSKEKTGGNLNAGFGKVEAMEDAIVLKELQQLVFAVPAYGIWENPDLNRDIPQRLPLKAFDLQAPNEPLNLKALEKIL